MLFTPCLIFLPRRIPDSQVALALGQMEALFGIIRYLVVLCTPEDHQFRWKQIDDQLLVKLILSIP